MKKLLSFLCLLAAIAASARAEQIVALTGNNRLVFFDSQTPATVTRSVNISGLTTGAEILVGLDFRPATGALYAVSNASRLYQINVTTGVATAVGAAGAFTLSGTSFDVDFNPVADRLRITSDAGQNLRVNPNDGTLAATDSPLMYAVGDRNAGVRPNVVGSAYTNNSAKATATVLYDIDSNLDILAIQNPPNAGTLNTVGPLGVDTSGNVGFDISGASGQAYAMLAVGGITGLYTIDLVTGAATFKGPVTDPGGPGEPPSGLITDIAVLAETQFRNLSTRGRVGTGDDVLIGGFIARGSASLTVVFRAIGPSLPATLTNKLPDPVLTIYNSSGTVLATNDDWRTSDQATQIMDAGLAPADERESAILLNIGPGAYTAIVSGKGSATGTALVEMYEL